jgi:hypothetical protein
LRRILIIGGIIFGGLIFLYYSSVIRSHEKLYDTVKSDFVNKYPDYQFIDCGIEDGDMIAVYIEIKYKRPGDESILEEVWQYWDTDTAWLHRDKYLELTNNK